MTTWCFWRLYDDRLEIRNAGSLPLALTTEALFHEHDSVPRNRKIAEAFFYAGFIERWGSGTLRMAEGLQAADLPPPQFESTSGRFRLCFYRQPPEIARPKKIVLSERQLTVMAYLKEHESISNAQYQALVGVSKRTASRELNELTEKGVLTSEGEGRGTIYKLREL